MPNYDFTSLDDKEFEALVTGLLSEHLRVHVERFKAGKDGGIDGRYFTADGEVIIQCKHWAKTGIAPLLRALKGTELDKVRKLNPSRYILATSVGLSPANKAKIKSIFDPFIKTDADVIGCDDVNSMLEKYPHIEEANFKLWLHSSTVLKQIANSALAGRSQFELDQIHRNRARYIETKSHPMAIQKLDENGVILITGEPGVGKTTLAEQLCFDYTLRGFQLCVAGSQIEELEAIYSNESQQIFYFDDFLGRTFLEALSRHEDSHIVGFIKRVRADKRKRLILTSRTTILNRGKALAEVFRIEKLERHELEIRVAELDEMERARILHSCLWFSGLPREYVEAISLNKNYRKVIAHRNFNPRLISFITDPGRLTGITSEGYWEYFVSMLENPRDVWEHVFDQQISDHQRLLLLLVVCSGRTIAEDDLHRAYIRLLDQKIANRFTGDKDFIRNARVLVGSVLNRTLDKSSNTSYTLFNPSIADFAIPRIARDSDLIAALFSSLQSNQALEYLGNLMGVGKIKRSVSKEAIKAVTSLVPTSIADPSTLQFNITVTRLAVRNFPDLDETKNAAIALLNSLRLLPLPSEHLARVALILTYCIENEYIDADFVEPFVVDIDENTVSFEQLNEINSITSSFAEDEDRDRFESILHPLTVYVVEDAFSEELIQRDTLEGLYDLEDTAEAERRLVSTAEQMLREAGIEPEAGDISQLVGSVDVADLINDNIERASNAPDDGEYRRGEIGGSADSIDDLFVMDVPPSSS